MIKKYCCLKGDVEYSVEYLFLLNSVVLTSTTVPIWCCFLSCLSHLWKNEIKEYCCLNDDVEYSVGYLFLLHRLVLPITAVTVPILCCFFSPCGQDGLTRIGAQSLRLCTQFPTFKGVCSENICHSNMQQQGSVRLPGFEGPTGIVWYLFVCMCLYIPRFGKTGWHSHSLKNTSKMLLCSCLTKEDWWILPLL